MLLFAFVIALVLLSLFPLVYGACADVRPKSFYRSDDATAWQSPIIYPGGNAGFASDQKLLPLDANGVPTMTPCELVELQEYCLSRVNYYRIENPPFGRPSDTTWGGGRNQHQYDSRFPPPNSPHEYDGKRREVPEDSPERRPLKPVNAKMMRCQNEKSLSDLLIEGPHTDETCSHPSAKGGCEIAEFVKAQENSCCRRRCDSLFDCKKSLDRCLDQMWQEGKDVMKKEAGGDVSGKQIFHYLAMLVPNKEFGVCGFGFANIEGENWVTMNQAFYGPKDLYDHLDETTYPKVIKFNDNGIKTLVDKPGVGMEEISIKDLDRSNDKWMKGPHATYFDASWSLCKDTCTDPNTSMQIDNQCISCFGKDYSIANVGGGGGVEDVNCVERPARRSTCTTVGEEVQPTITRSAAGNGTPCRERSIVCTRGDGSIPLPIVDVDCVESPAERGTCTTVGEEIFPRIQTQKAGNGRRCPQVPVVCGAGDIPFLVVNPPQTDEWQSGGCNDDPAFETGLTYDATPRDCTYFCENNYNVRCDLLLGLVAPAKVEMVKMHCPSKCDPGCESTGQPLYAAQQQDDEQPQPKVVVVEASEENKTISIVMGAAFGAIFVIGIAAGITAGIRFKRRNGSGEGGDDHEAEHEDVPLSPPTRKMRRVMDGQTTPNGKTTPVLFGVSE